MYTSLLAAGLAAIATTQAADIVCFPKPISSGTLWYGVPTGSYIGQLGIYEGRGNAEYLAKYPSNNVVPHNVNVFACNSTALSAHPNAAGDIPVIIQLADDTGYYLSRIAGATDQDCTIIRQAYIAEDTSSQFVQFWTLTAGYGTLLPTWQSKKSDRWNIQFYEPYASNQVAAVPAHYREGVTPLNGTRYALKVKK